MRHLSTQRRGGIGLSMARAFGWITSTWIPCLSAMTASLAGGCASNDMLNRLIRENETLKREKLQTEREAGRCQAANLALVQQIQNLKSFSDRPAELFAPASLRILDLTGGRNLDPKPGDDVVMVYVQPRDAEGDAVKAPGRITVQLLDNADLASPRLIGVTTFEDPEQLRRFWHGRFLTYHYSLTCPIPESAKVSSTGRVTVSVCFDDFLTGRSLTAVKEIDIVPRGE